MNDLINLNIQIIVDAEMKRQHHIYSIGCG